MTNAQITISFLGGTSITDAFTEALRLSHHLQCNIEFNFNGITCWVTPAGNVDKGVASYHSEIGSDHKHKFASA